jgi:uncharacterized protein (TIGR02145 family)
MPFLGLNLNLFASFNIWASGGTAIDAQETAILSSFTRANPVTSSKSSLFPSWQFSMSITVDNTANPNTLTDYSVLVILNTADLIAQGKMMSSGADIRFTLDDINQLPYWIDPGIQNERGINTDSTHIWVKIPVIPASGQLTLFMFYGNFSASPVSDIHSTFLFGDDFEDNALDASKWEVILANSGQVNEQNQRLEHNSPTTAQPYESGSNLLSIAQFTEPVVLEMQFKKGGYVYRNVGLCMDNTVWDNSAAFGWQDYGPLYATTSLSGTPTSVEFNNGITNWSTYNGNPEYYLKIIRKPDGKFSYSMIVPATEPGGPQVWNVDIDLPMPIEIPLRVRATEHVWQSASPELRFEDNIRVRKYSYPEPTTKVNKLVAYYPFNGGVMDESGNDNGGITVVNGAILTNDRFGEVDKAYAFNGSSDNISLGNSLNLINGKASFTISAWINPNFLDDFGQFTILGERDNGSNYQLAINSKNMYFSYWSNGNELMLSGSPLATNRWQYLTVTYDGVIVKFFINGVFDTSFPAGGTIDSNPSTLYVGTTNGTEGFFSGSIDEIRFYNYPLSENEITQLYANYYAPKILVAEPGDGQVTLKWSSERINEINHYNIYQDGTGIATIQVTNPMDTVYTISGLVNHQTYEFYITSTDHSGNTSQPSVHLFKAPSATTVTDIDGNTYSTVTIGTQEWMAENLRTTKYNDGSSITQVLESALWMSLTTPAYCWYNNDAATHKETYGALYNWYTVSMENICPIGWHVPTDAEWYTLENYVDPTINDPNATGYRGIDGGTKLKASYGWAGGVNGTDEYDFMALPAGVRSYQTGSFVNLYYRGYWWSADESDVNYSWIRFLDSEYETIGRNYSVKQYGYPVRCVKDQPPILSLTTSPVTSITPYSATCGGNITDDGGDPIARRGVVWSIDQDPNILYNYNGFTEDGEGTGEFMSSIVNLTPSTQYYVRAYVINSIDTVYANQQTFTTYNADAISDVDGNYYNVITIGSQEWLAENLRTIHYSNGDPIDNIVDNTEWSNLATDAHCWYQNDYNSYGATYGALYNWYAAINTSGVCPAGWRVPSRADFNSLAETLGGSSVAGGKMKTLGYDYWLSPNEGATNESGFNGIGHGYRNTGGEFGLLNEYGEYWTTDEQDASTSWAYFLRYNYQDISSINEWKGSGFAVRCIKNSEVQGVIAHYPFNGNANDESGNELHGTVYGGATLTTDRYYADNSAWSFNGSDSYVSIPGILPAGSNPLFTVSQWIYIEDYTWGAFFGSGQTVENNKHISLNVSVSGTTRELGVDHWGSQWNTGYIMPVGWHMVTYVSDGSQDIVYVNGQLIGARTIEFTLEEGAETSIGRWNDQAGTNYYFNSKIDDISIYNYALTAQDIAALYQQENPYAGGIGTEADPWLIATPEQLNLVRQSPEAGRYFRQINDIDLNQWPWNEGEGWEPIGNSSYPFKGNYNGNGFKVVGLSSQRSGTNFIGLFGYVTEGTITNLGVANFNVSGYQYVGGLAGFIYQSNVNNCYTSGIVTSADNYTGGLVGMSSNFSEIQSSYSTAEVFGYQYTGGLVGDNNYSTINNCYATGAVHGSYSGGLVGYSSEGNITNSYSIGSTETTYGGLICLRNGGSVTYSYWDFLASGVVNSNGGGIGLITGAMTENSSFENWDFNSIWAISEGITYPYLQWQSEPSEHNIANVTQGFEGGAGTESNPWQIATPTQLDNIRNFKDGGYYFNLIADIDLNQSPWNEGEGWIPVGIDGYPFDGHFNGNGHSINGLYINRPENGYQGLFGNINESTINNLRIENCNITAHDYVGAVAGVVGNSSISNCSSTGFVVGYNYSGGLIGLMGSNSIVEYSYSVASIAGNNYVGGLSGYTSQAQIANSYAAGDVSGYEFVGGIVGYCSEGGVVNCYSTGKVTADGYQYYTGGLIGYGSPNVQSSYWDTQTSGQLASNGGEGKTTGYMLEQELYAGWDFNETWAIQEYQTYPYLRWQSQPGDHNFVSDIQGPFAGGAGTPTNPWQISTREQLDSLRRYLGPEHSDKYFMIINDIDLYNYPATGPGWLPIGIDSNPFFGHLDGNGHSLSSLNLNRSTLYNVGLFGYINQGSISNLTLSNPFVYGDYSVGGIAGNVNNGTINNCHVLDGSVTGNVSSYGDNIGSIAGEITNQSTITNSSATAVVNGRGFLGGLAGKNYSNSVISYSSYSGDITASNNYYVGGIVGYNYYSSILECNATGSVTSQGYYVGGLVGYNQTSTITSSYSSSSVVGIDDVGGFIGESEGTSSESSLISNCYASGSVQGNARVGGLIGYNYQTSSLSDCSATGNVSGNSSVGGLIGQQGSPNYSQTISNCYSLGTVTATGNNYVGGFMGYFAGGNITNSYTLSQVNAPNTNYVGGFVGYANAGTISSCFATGQVEGNISVGGFMGTRYLATISNSYSTGNVTGNQYAGGFMGSVEAGQTQSIVNCYSVGHVKCDNYAGGFAGSVNSGELVYCFYNFETAGKSDNDGRGEPRGLGEMLQSNTFTYWEWDFATVWTIIEGTTYPFLQWQVEPSVFNYPPVTPTVSTLSISEITTNSATLMGRVDDDGGAYILSRGVVWSTSENPSLDDYLGVSYCGDGGGDYSCEIIDLNSSTTYYARAFATSVAGTAYGEPHSFTTASSWINRDFMFAAGYTWFSFNLSDVAVQPNTIFSGYTFINNDRIIGQTQYSIFDEGVWVGSLPSISGNQMYKLNLFQPLNFNLGGQPAAIVPIELNAGYTWLGYLPQECLTISDALANSSFQNQLTGDERIIGQNGFAVYDFSQGIWTGDLTQMCPGEGYIIKLNEYNVLTYPNYGKEVPGKEIESNFSASGISVSLNKQHTMMLIATLQVNDKEIVIDEGDMLFAFAGEECRGAVAVMKDKLIFMSIGSDGNLPVEQINFRLWNSKTSTFFDIQEVFTFQPLKELGTLASPTQLTVGKGATDNSTIISETVSVGDPQPNPFTHFTSIPVVLAKPSMVRIGVYSPAGLLVKQTGNFSFDSGLQRVVVYKGDLKPGIYIYTVEITYDSERVVKNGRFVVD